MINPSKKNNNKCLREFYIYCLLQSLTCVYFLQCSDISLGIVLMSEPPVSWSICTYTIGVMKKQWQWIPYNATWAHSASLWLSSNCLSRKERTKTRLLQHNWTVMSLARSTELRGTHRNTIRVDIHSENVSWAVDAVLSCVGSRCVVQPDTERKREKENKREKSLKGNRVYKMHHASGAEFINTLARARTHTRTNWWRIPNEWSPHRGHGGGRRAERKGGVERETDRKRRETENWYTPQAFTPRLSMHDTVIVY